MVIYRGCPPIFFFLTKTSKIVLAFVIRDGYTKGDDNDKGGIGNAACERMESGIY